MQSKFCGKCSMKFRLFLLETTLNSDKKDFNDLKYVSAWHWSKKEAKDHEKQVIQIQYWDIFFKLN